MRVYIIHKEAPPSPTPHAPMADVYYGPDGPSPSDTRFWKLYLLNWKCYRLSCISWALLRFLVCIASMHDVNETVVQCVEIGQRISNWWRMVLALFVIVLLRWQKCFAVSEVAADWHDLTIPLHIVQQTFGPMVQPADIPFQAVFVTES